VETVGRRGTPRKGEDVAAEQAVRELLDRVYAAFGDGDAAAIDDLVSHDPGVLAIGPDPSMWWPGRDGLVSRWKNELEHGPINVVPGDPVAYAAGDLAWAADRPKVGRGGKQVEIRVTLVARREGKEWRILHWHASVGAANIEEAITR
jgi:ketosteroid isomerase-like protein